MRCFSYKQNVAQYDDQTLSLMIVNVIETPAVVGLQYIRTYVRTHELEHSRTVATLDKNKAFDHTMVSIMYKMSCANVQCQSTSYSLFLRIHSVHAHFVLGTHGTP